MARGKHLFPFRTEPLSPSAPMVLGPQGPGRVGRRRVFLRYSAMDRSDGMAGAGSAGAPHGGRSRVPGSAARLAPAPGDIRFGWASATRYSRSLADRAHARSPTVLTLARRPCSRSLADRWRAPAGPGTGSGQAPRPQTPLAARA